MTEQPPPTGRESPSGIGSPGDAMVFLRLAVGRSTGYVIGADLEPSIFDILTRARAALAPTLIGSEENAPASDEEMTEWDRAYTQAVVDYANAMIRALPRSNRMEGRAALRLTRDPELPVAVWTEALRRVCPLWPFC